MKLNFQDIIFLGAVLWFKPLSSPNILKSHQYRYRTGTCS